MVDSASAAASLRGEKGLSGWADPNIGFSDCNGRAARIRSFTESRLPHRHCQATFGHEAEAMVREVGSRRWILGRSEAGILIGSPIEKGRGATVLFRPCGEA